MACGDLQGYDADQNYPLEVSYFYSRYILKLNYAVGGRKKI